MPVRHSQEHLKKLVPLWFNWNKKQTLKKEAIVLVRNTFDSEASLTGFGDTMVDFSKMTYMPSEQAIKLLNVLYQIVIENEG